MSPDSEFSLDERLARDSQPICQLDLCELRLMNDHRYPWLLLVPQRAGLREIIDLPPPERRRFYSELDRVCETLLALTRADKLNVAALGNLVPQLHAHVIARFKSDAAWPGPVWGLGEAEPYTEKLRDERIAQLRQALC